MVPGGGGKMGGGGGGAITGGGGGACSGELRRAGESERCGDNEQSETSSIFTESASSSRRDSDLQSKQSPRK